MTGLEIDVPAEERLINATVFAIRVIVSVQHEPY